MKLFDYLIVGSGLFGSVFAHEMTQRGKSCLVIDKRPHTGGNVYCREQSGITIHEYGPHIFHTDDERVWEYVNRFAKFNRFTNSPIAVYHGRVYNLPFNMNTFYQMWGFISPEEARAKIKAQVEVLGIKEPRSLEEQALSMVGPDVYECLVKGYTEKQWGRPCWDLPPSIIRRLPLRFTFDNNYFTSRYQGIPIGGYNRIIDALLQGVTVRLNTDFFDIDSDSIAERIVFTGPIDAFYGHRYGRLEYRSLRFETEELQTDNFQGNAVVNYTDAAVPFTRIIEHKHFEFGQQPTTVITREYPMKWELGMEPFYPVNDEQNNALYAKYAALAQKEKNVIFGGRLGSYRYYDMDQVIAAALDAVEKEINDAKSLSSNEI